MNIKLYFTEVNPSINEGFRIPMVGGNIYPDFHRENGSTAKVVDFNRLIITTIYGIEEYVVSFELSGNNEYKMMARLGDANIRFWQAVEGVVMAKLNNLVRYINNQTW